MFTEWKSKNETVDLGKREYNTSDMDEEQSKLAFGWGTKTSTETVSHTASLPCHPGYRPPPRVNGIVIKQLKCHTLKRGKQHHRWSDACSGLHQPQEKLGRSLGRKCALCNVRNHKDDLGWNQVEHPAPVTRRESQRVYWVLHIHGPFTRIFVVGINEPVVFGIYIVSTVLLTLLGGGNFELEMEAFAPLIFMLWLVF